MKKIKLFSLLLCFVLSICTIGSAIAVSGVRMAGEQRKVMEQADENVAFKVNGEEVLEKDFNTYLALMRETNSSLTTDEIKDKYIRQRVIFQEAIKRGYTASSEEVETLTKSRFVTIEQEPEAYKIIEEYVNGLGITMEEYIAQSQIISEQAIISTKMKNDIEAEFLNTLSINSTLSEYEQQSKAEKYYNEYIDGLVKNAVVD